MSIHTYFKGFGYYTPAKVLDNHELSRLVDTSDEWIRTRTGIQERHIAADNENCADLAAIAASKAIEEAGFKPEEITHILAATFSADAFCPSTSTIIQHKLGIKYCMSLDINVACSGFIYGLNLAQALINLHPEAKILLVASEILSRKVNWSDRSTCVLFGDGAGAVVLTAESAAITGPATSPWLEGVLCSADGSLGDLLVCDGGCSRHPYKMGDVVGEEHFIKMNGREIFKHAVRSMAAVSNSLLEQCGYTIDDIDVLIPHQANLRIIEAVGQRLNVPTEKVFINVHKYGNTSAASIPIAMAEAMQTGFIKPGMRILMTTFGAGLTWGSAIIKF